MLANFKSWCLLTFCLHNLELIINVLLVPHAGWGGVDNICWDPQPGGVSLNDGLYIMVVAVK